MPPFELGIVMPLKQFGKERTTARFCAEEGRDPASIGRSIDVLVDPSTPAGERPNVVSGPPEEIARRLRSFRDAGHTQAELMCGPGPNDALEALAPVVGLVGAG